VSDIVQNLRGFARLDQAAIDRLDLNGAIASTLELIRGRLEQHQIEVVQKLGEIPQIVCAPAQINQVVLNLCSTPSRRSQPRDTWVAGSRSALGQAARR
jgi:Signal transduction histidine kinase regulating C4-dicarboxylate transport system